MGLMGCLLAAGLQAGTMQDAQSQFKALPGAAKLGKTEKALAELGRDLFFDPRLSASQLISCNSCHNLALGGGDLQKTSIGHGWQKGPRNAPTVLNSSLHVAQFWDGRAPNLEAQAKGPVQAGVEMANTPQRVEETLTSMPGYQKAFKEAFPGQPQPVTFDNMAKAIAAFEATLLTPSSLDQYLAGKEKALNAAEKKGLELFLATGCASCHNGVNLGGNSFQKFGVVKAPSEAVRPKADLGRANQSKAKDDEYIFRVPTLRNIAVTGPYFHSGAVASLEEAVGIMAEVQLGKTLTTDEKKSIAIFLGSLTGKLPKVTYPLLPEATATTPAPLTEVGKAGH